MSLFGDTYLSDGEADQRESLHDGTEMCPRTSFSSYGGDIFTGHQMGNQERGSVDHFWPLRHRFLPFGFEYLENGKSQRYESRTLWGEFVRGGAFVRGIMSGGNMSRG